MRHLPCPKIQRNILPPSNGYTGSKLNEVSINAQIANLGNIGNKTVNNTPTIGPARDAKNSCFLDICEQEILAAPGSKYTASIDTPMLIIAVKCPASCRAPATIMAISHENGSSKTSDAK